MRRDDSGHSVVEGCTVPPGFHIPSTVNVHSDADLARIELVTADESSFSESITQANARLVSGYLRIRNEF